MKRYAFSFVNGEFMSGLLDTIPLSLGGTFLDDQGAFGYASDNGTTRSVELILPPGQASLAVHESTRHPRPGWKTNNANDFVCKLDSIPYLYRYGERRGYRLYDLADAYTRSVLFASSAGDVKNSGAGEIAVVSDDDAAGAPGGDPFDTISCLSGDAAAGAVVLIPVPK